MKRPIEANIVIVIALAVAVNMLLYWITWFTAPEFVQSRSPDAPDYLIYVSFEQAFPLPDGWLALAALIGAVGLWRMRDWGYVFALVTGLSVSDISQNAVNLGWDRVRLPHPVFDGDTLYAQSEVLEKRESKSRPNMGIVRFKTSGLNQDGAVVIEFERTILVYKRGFAPDVRPPVAGP